MRARTSARRAAAAAAALAACATWHPFEPALPPAPALDAARISADVAWLADDAREGRGAGTQGLADAARWLADAFRAAGLAPAGRAGSWFQAFEVPIGIEVARESLALHGVDLVAGRDYAALLSSGSGAARGPLAFAGYGIAAPEQGYDDFAQLDVAGAVVLVLDDRPPGADELFSGVHGNALLGRARKIANARDRGARAVLLAPSASEAPDAAPLDLRDPSAGPSQSSSAIPVLSLSRDAAERLVAHAGGPPLAERQRAIDASRQPASQRFDATIALEVEIDRRSGEALNVIGRLEGADPALRREALVIGAHYDHLGRGEFGSLAPARRGEVHNGADDNASGTAGLVELARAFAAGPRPRRSLVFAAFAGEESGLFGSRSYVEDPPVPLADTVAMLNLDMVGRLRERRLVVFGTGSSPAFPPLLRRALRGLPLEASFAEDGFAPSDQTSFYAHGVPVLMFFTGAHPEYHTPDDDAALVNAEGEAVVLSAAYRVARALLDEDGRPEVVAAKAPAPGGSGGGGYGPWLGTVPAFGGPEGPGVLLQGVVPGSPAEAAGIRAGDRIVRFAGASVANLEELAARLYSARPGELVAIEVLRGDERIALEARLGRRR